MSEPPDGLPRATYWWRRVSIALVLVAVVVLAVVLSRLGSDGSSSAKSTSPVTSSSPASASPSTTPTTTPLVTAPITPPATTPTVTTNAEVTCSASDVSVVVTPATRTFSGAATFTTTLTNSGAACTLPSGLQLVVTSGQDRIWSNVDCTPASAGGKQAVAAGKSVAATRSWDRARSRPACATVIGTKTAGPGVYRATATWGSLTSSPAIFNLG
ncbi:MAG TPA: hypothetical protein VGX45_10020 [Solirubrobacteraceae bacterium]|nr:hypothetical protein [Solirubrobacteraceae bacterium]